MTIHCVKIQETYANAVNNHSKPFEIRFNDRNYCAGDQLVFLVIGNEKHPLNGTSWDITYVYDGPFGLQPGYVVLGIKEHA